MPLVFPVVRILQNCGADPLVCAGPPGPALGKGINLIQTGRPASEAVRGPGVRPTIFADRPVMRKTSALAEACPTLLVTRFCDRQ